MLKALGKIGSARFGNLSKEKQAGLFGVGWTALGQIAAIFIRFGSSLLLTRLLNMDTYGFFGIAMSVSILVELFSDIGLRPALTRHADGENSAYVATAWTILIIRSFVMAGLMIGMGLLLPQFYTDYNKRLFFLVEVALAVRPILHACANPMSILLHKQLRFGTWAAMEFGQTIVGTIGTLTFAYLFHNVWAVVIGILLGEAAFVALSYAWCERPPRPTWDKAAAKELAHIGNQVFVNTLVMGLWIYVDRLVGPVFTSAEKMAPYLLAYTLMEAIERLMGKATDVYFSTLVKVGSFQQQVEFHTRTCNRIAMFLMPLLAIGIMAAPMVVKVYGSNYRAAGLGILFAVLVCRVMFRILGQVHYQLFMIQGEIYLATRCYYLALFVQLITIFPLAKFYGTLGIAYSVCISTFVLTLSQNLIFNHRKYMDMKSFLITFGYAAAGFTALVFLEM